MPAEAAKVSCSNQNFVSQRQAFYKSGGLSLVPVRPWSRSGAIASWARCDWWCDGGGIGGGICTKAGSRTQELLDNPGRGGFCAEIESDSSADGYLS